MADLLDPNDLHPQALAHRPPTAADAVEAQARIDAVKRWLDAVRDRLRDFIEDQAETVEAATGGVFNLPVTGVGRALMTDPTPKPRVTDPRVFAEWLADNDYDAHYQRRIDVKVHSAASQDELTKLAKALDRGLSDPSDADTVCELLVVDRYYTPHEEALDWLLDDPDSRVMVLDAYDPPYVAHLDEDGEAQEVPGTSVSLASRRLQVRIDSDHKDDLDAAVERAVGPPQLDGNNDER